MGLQVQMSEVESECRSGLKISDPHELRVFYFLL